VKKALISLKRKEDICATLKQLLKRKSIQKITIQELADACGISRYTFYYHFTDIYDCFSWMLQDELRGCLQQIESSRSWEDALVPVLQSIRENRTIYKHLLSSPRPDLLHQFFYQEIRSLIQLYLSMMLENSHYQAKEPFLSFLTDFFTSATEGMLISRIQADPDYSDELLTEYLHTVLDGLSESILKRAEQKGFCRKIQGTATACSVSRPDGWNYLL